MFSMLVIRKCKMRLYLFLIGQIYNCNNIRYHCFPSMNPYTQYWIFLSSEVRQVLINIIVWWISRELHTVKTISSKRLHGPWFLISLFWSDGLDWWWAGSRCDEKQRWQWIDNAAIWCFFVVREHSALAYSLWVGIWAYVLTCRISPL